MKININRPVHSLAWIDDKLAIGNASSIVYIQDMSTGERKSINLDGNKNVVVLTPKKFLITGDERGQVFVISPSGMRRTYIGDLLGSPIESVADNDDIIVISTIRKVWVYYWDEHFEMERQHIYSSAGGAIALHDNILAIIDGGDAIIYSISTNPLGMEKISEFHFPHLGKTTLAFDGKTIATASSAGVMMRSLDGSISIDIPTDIAGAVSLSRGYLAWAGYNGNYALYDTRNGDIVASDQLGKGILSCTLSPNSTQIAIGKEWGVEIIDIIKYPHSYITLPVG
jgi:hypothetical protein